MQICVQIPPSVSFLLSLWFLPPFSYLKYLLVVQSSMYHSVMYPINAFNFFLFKSYTLFLFYFCVICLSPAAALPSCGTFYLPCSHPKLCPLKTVPSFQSVNLFFGFPPRYFISPLVLSVSNSELVNFS